MSHGSVVDGRFEGFIKTHQGTYYVEPSERYLEDQNGSFHSIIYHEDDIGKYASTDYCPQLTPFNPPLPLFPRFRRTTQKFSTAVRKKEAAGLLFVHSTVVIFMRRYKDSFTTATPRFQPPAKATNTSGVFFLL